MMKLMTLAGEACREHDDIESQIVAVRARLDDDPTMLSDLMEFMLTSAIRAAVHDARHHLRTQAKAGTVECKRGVGALGSIGAKVFASLLDSWIMADGRQLGDYLGGELLPAAEEEKNIARGYALNAAFYVALSNRTPVRGKVRNYVNADEAVAIWDSLRGGGDDATTDAA